jgi:putative transcriptional regulator
LCILFWLYATFILMEKEDYLRALGERVYTIRKSKGMTQIELGARIKKDQQSIQRLEKGNINPSIFYLYEIAQGLETTVQDLLSFEFKARRK